MGKDFQLRLLPWVPEACIIPDDEIQLLADGQHPDPKHVLGVQVIGSNVILRCWISGAEAVSVTNAEEVFLPELSDAREDPPEQVALLPVERCPGDCPWLFERAFEYVGTEDKSELQKWNYEVCIRYPGGSSCSITYPHSLGALLPESFLTGFAAGLTETPLASMFGAHHMELRSHKKGLWGTRFAVWAPNAHSVSLVGDFNYWDGRAHPMSCREKFGVWEIFLPSWDLRGQKYAYQVVSEALEPVVKADPCALEFVDPSDGGHDAKVPECDDYSRAAWNGTYPWTDDAFIAKRQAQFGSATWCKEPLSIYEVHLGSWTMTASANYRDIAEPLAKHVQELGFTAVEFLPLSQYPCEESWGYQCAAGLFAVDRRLGTPDDFRYLVDTLHSYGIAVFMDFVGAHFAKDEWGLENYSGTPQYEYEGTMGQIPGWGTCRFNYAKPEVQAYLLGAAHHWIEHFHIDGLRVDAVAAMIYRNFGREEDGDKIMAGKGKLNEDGIALLRRLCAEVRSRHPGVILSAEESTNFKWVTDRPAENGTERHQAEIRDLGFHLKWNMGFAYDALSYFGADPEERPQLDTFGWKRLAWYLAYAFNERWVLPFSHDNMQPKSLLDQMAPNKRVGVEGQFAQLRLLFLYMVGMPGRPLMFMGSEIGEGFSLAQPVDWELAAVDPDKQQLRSWVAKLMKLYRQLKCLHRQEDRADGFHWLDKDSSSRCVYAWKRLAKDEPEAIIVVNASMTHVSPYYINSGDTSGAWKCVAANALGDCVTTPRSARVVMGRAKFATELPPMAAQIWVPCECEEAVDEAALLNFEVLHQEAQPGDELRLVGNCPELGNWVVSEGVIMETDADTFPFWHTSMRIPLDVRNLEFKMVAVSAAGEETWEPLRFNRSVSIIPGVVQRVSIEFGEV